MRALLLAAGYGTRLLPLTEDCPKTLLSVGGRPMVAWILDGLARVPGLDRVALVTNARFAPHHRRWLSGYRPPRPSLALEVVDDGTSTEQTKLGAVADIRLGRDRLMEGTGDDLLVVAGDNLFELDVARFAAFALGKGSPAVALKDMRGSPLLSRYGLVEIDASARVVGFEEKPAKPRSSLASTCLYLFPKASLPLLDRYLSSGGNPDAPGHYLQWLYRETAVYGWVFTEDWLDIGDLASYEEANARYAATAPPVAPGAPRPGS